MKLRLAPRHAAALLALLLASRLDVAAGPATIYTAGDLTATTSVVGSPVCGTTTASMAVEDGTSFSTLSASEFAALVPAARGSVPSPMGQNTSAATAGRWAVTVLNPGRTPLNVSQVDIDANGATFFNGISAVQPVSGWTSTTSAVTWTGSLDVPPHSALDFIVQIAPRSQTGAASITLRATTPAGVLTASAFTTLQRNSTAEPYVSLPFVVNGLDVFSGNATNNGTVETGLMQTFQVRVKESEAGNTQPIPAGSTLTITVPQGWTGVAASGGQTAFGNPVVTQPTGCATGSVVVATNATILNTSRVFQFTAFAPANAAGVGLYPFQARLQGATPGDPIDTRTEFTQEVGIPLTGGTRAGITAVEADLSVPNPMGSKKQSIWGVAVANPLATPYTVTRIDITMTQGNNFFNAVTAMRPATGWVRISSSNVRWTGSLTIPPHDAENFFVQIQANNNSGTNRPARVTVNNTITKDALTSQGNGNGTICANLFYLTAGQPSVYTYGGASGQPKSFTVAIRETNGTTLNTGAVLRVVIPAGWSAVTAPTVQTGFTTRTIIQPTPTTPGEVRTTTSVGIDNAQQTFQFTATSPPNLLDSLYVFPTTLTNAQVSSICDMVVLVTDNSGGLEVDHLSPPVAETSLNQLDVQVVSSAAPDTSFTASIYNFAAAAWEPLSTRTLTSSPTTMLASITSNFDQYFDAPLADVNKHARVRMKATGQDNYRCDEDYVAFIVSQYRVTPVDRAPANTFRGALDVPMLSLVFSTDTGTVDLYTVKVTGGGTDVVNDVPLVHLLSDANCNGLVDGADADLVPAQPFLPDGTVTFGTAPAPLLTFADGTPSCAIVAYDISPTATAFDIVSAHLAGGFDVTSSVGPLYPFPATGGYPVDSGSALIPGGPPQLALVKSYGPPLSPPAIAYSVGTTVTYTIDVTNIGESASTNVVISDPLDAAWAPYTGIITPLDGGVLCVPPACDPARIDWPVIATLAGNTAQTATVRFQARIPNSVPDATSLPNAARAVSTEEPLGDVSNTAGLPVCAPVVELVKSLPASPVDYAAGEIVQWTITIRNTGSCPATSVSVSDVVDVVRLDEATLVFNPPGSYDAGTDTQTWTVASLAPNATATFLLEGTVLPAAEGSSLCNSATATWDEATATLASDPPGGSCTLPVVPPRCTQSLVVNKTLPLSPPDYAEGEVIEWTITVQNNGNCAATGVAVRDTIDTALLEPPFVFTPATGIYDPGTSTYTWPAATVQGSGSEVLTYRVSGVIKSGTEGSTICNTALVSFNEGPDVTSNPTSGTCSSVPIIPPRCTQSLQVVKLLPVTPADYAEGEPVEWTIRIVNSGTCTATSVVVRDVIDLSALEAPFVFTPGNAVFSLGTVVWPAATIQGNSTEILEYRVLGTIRAGTQGRTICDTAVVSFAEGADVTSSPTTGTCTTVPVVPPRCVVASLVAPSDVKVAKSNVSDLAFTWTGGGGLEQHLNSVALKSDVPSAKRSPVGVGVAECTGPASGCVVTGAVTAPPARTFYQAYAACGATGSDEGP